MSKCTIQTVIVISFRRNMTLAIQLKSSYTLQKHLLHSTLHKQHNFSIGSDAPSDITSNSTAWSQFLYWFHNLLAVVLHIRVNLYSIRSVVFTSEAPALFQDKSTPGKLLKLWIYCNQVSLTGWENCISTVSRNVFWLLCITVTFEWSCAENSQSFYQCQHLALHQLPSYCAILPSLA